MHVVWTDAVQDIHIVFGTTLISLCKPLIAVSPFCGLSKGHPISLGLIEMSRGWWHLSVPMHCVVAARKVQFMRPTGICSSPRERHYGIMRQWRIVSASESRDDALMHLIGT